MNTPRSQAGPTAADSGPSPSPADQDAAPGRVRPYADPGRGYVSTGPPPPDHYGYDTELPPGWPGPAEAVAAPPGRSGPRDEPEELFPAASQPGGTWPEPDLGDEEQAAAEYDRAEYDRAEYDRAGIDTADHEQADYDRADYDRAEPAPAEPAAAQAEAGPSIMRSSGVMALGTLASRGTGLLRTLVQAYALGVFTLSVAFNNA